MMEREIPSKKKENGDDGTFCWHWPSLSNHTKMHHLVTVIKFHNYIKSAFNLSNVLAWSINLYLFVVCINSVHHRWDLLDSKHFESFSDFGFSWGWCVLIFMELYVSRKKLCQRHLWIHYWAQSYLVLYLFVTIDQNDHAYPQGYRCQCPSCFGSALMTVMV